MKKFLAILLATVICLGLFTACKNNSTPISSPSPSPPMLPENTDNEPDGTDDIFVVNQQRQKTAGQYGLPYTPEMDLWEPVAFTYFILGTKEPPPPDNPILKIIEEVTNVKIDFQIYDVNSEIALGVMVETNDVPDLVYFGSNADKAITTGKFMPLDRLIESYAPRLREFYDPWWDFMKAGDGFIYTAEIYGTLTGTQTTMWDDTYAFWIQKDVLDHFGRAPVNIDEYFDFIREYKTLNPRIDRYRTIGFSVDASDYLNSGFVNAGYFMAGNANWGSAINLTGDLFGVVISPAERFADEFNRAWWQKLNEEYRQETFSRDLFSITNKNYLAQISTGAVLGIFDRGSNFQSAIDTLNEEERYERTYLPLALTFPEARPNYLDARSFTGGNGILISNRISDPERAIKFLDWIIDESVQRFLSWGIEGEHYYYDDNGRIARTQQQRELQSDEKWVSDNLGRFLLETMPKMQGSYPSDNNPTSPGESPEEHFATLTGYDRDLFEKLGIYTMTGFWGEPKQRPEFYPFNIPDPEENPEASLVIENIEKLLRGRTLRNLITAREENFESMWNEYIDLIINIDQRPLMDFYAEG